MLSYLHAFHAGNHADVLKHVVLYRCSRTSATKNRPLRYIETHAGAGGYDLRSRDAQRNREYESGIGLVLACNRTRRRRSPRSLRSCSATTASAEHYARYPGSPWLARQMLRPEDSLHLFELHPAEHRALAEHCAGDRRVTVARQDGLEGCIGLVPPPERRGLVFVDPSYEVDGEHEQVVAALSENPSPLRDGRLCDLVSGDRASLGRAAGARRTRHEHRPSRALRALRCARCSEKRAHGQRLVRDQPAVEASRGYGDRFAVACEDLGGQGQRLVSHRLEQARVLPAGAHGATYVRV